MAGLCGCATQKVVKLTGRLSSRFMKNKPVPKSLTLIASLILLYVIALSSGNPAVFRERDRMEDEVVTSRLIEARQTLDSTE